MTTIDPIRRYKRLVRNLRVSQELGEELGACDQGYGYFLVPADLFRRVEAHLLRLAGQAPGKAGESQ
jgi:hypothetical protein